MQTVPPTGSCSATNTAIVIPMKFPLRFFPLSLLFLLFLPAALFGQPDSGAGYEVRIHFPILDITGESGDERIAVVAAGRVHGVRAGGEGSVTSVYSEAESWRGGETIGYGRVVDVKDSTCVVRIAPTGSDAEEEVRTGDLMALPLNLPDDPGGSLLFDLTALHILFEGEDGALFYAFDPLARMPHGEREAYEEGALRRILAEVHRFSEELGPIAEADSSLAEPMSGGRFAGMTVMRGIAAMELEDIRSFLRFVRAYPARYMGNVWRPGPTCASWILNNTPLAQDDLRDRLMAAGSDEEVTGLLERHGEDIATGLFLYDWVSTAEGWMVRDSVQAAERLNRITERGARLQGDRTALAWTLFMDARLAEHAGDYAGAAGFYRRAAENFRESGSDGGTAAALNNLGSVLNSLESYEKALVVFDSAYTLKRERFEREGGGDNLESMGHTAAGRGLALAGLGRFAEGAAAYDLARSLYDSAGTPSGAANGVWALTRAANVMGRGGEYEGGLARLERAIAIYRERGDRAGEASALDEIAYICSLMERNRESLEYYEKAYELHLALGEKGNAGFSRSNMGQMYWRLGDYREAEKSHRMAILLREEAEDLPGQAYSWHRLGELFRESGDPNAALEAYGRAAEIYRGLGDRERLAEVQNSAGDVFYGQKSWRAALERYEDALAALRETGSPQSVALTLYNIGNVHFSDRKFEKAEEAFGESLRIRQEIGDKGNAVYSMTGLGLTAWNLREYDEAKRRFNAAMELAAEVNSRSDIAWCRLVIARVETQRGEYEQAGANFAEALKLYREGGEKSGEIDALLGIGELKVSQGKFEEGLAHYREAERLATETNNRTGIGSALSAIAGVHLLLGEFEQGLEADRRSLEISREVDNPWGVASACTGLGNTSNAMGDFRQAVEFYRRADSVYRQLGDTLARSTPMNNMGTVYFFQGDYERALDQFNGVLQILRGAGQEDESLAIAVSNIGEVYYEQGRLADAREWLLQGLEIEEKIGARRMIASTTTILARTELRAGNLNEAEKWGERALALTEEIGEQEQLAEIRGVMGELAMQRKRLPEAEAYLKGAVEVSGRIGSTRYLWRPLYFLGILQRDRGDRAGAVASLERSVETIEKLRDKVAGGEAAQKLFASNRSKVEVYEALVALLIEEGEIEKALGYLERSSSEDLRARFRSLDPSFADPEKRELLEKGREMKARIDKLAGQIAAERGGTAVAGEKVERLQEIISVAENDYIRFVNETIREQPDLRNYFSAGVNPIELRQRKQKIPSDVAVVSYLIGERQIFAFAATADTVVARVAAVPRADVEWKIANFCRALGEPGNEEDVRRGAAELYDLLLAPVEDRIAGYDKLAIIPSGDLSYLPFGALRNEEDETYLMERHTIFYISDLGVFLTQEEEEKKMSLVAFGNADGTLPHAEEEVRDIAPLCPESRVYLRGDATEERAKNLPQGYDMLHFATHGNLDYRRIENSWLTLAPSPDGTEDGRLTLEEVWGISNLADCRLVTLSACNTAVSEDVVEGWPVNPANAFLQVGVPRVVATLWQVDDAATALLMRAFYGNLQTHGTAEALKLAQLSLASTEQYSSPYFWAPFVLLGDWR